MSRIHWACFMLYTGMLAWEDLKRGRISLLLLFSGTLAGLGFCALELFQGKPWQSCLLLHGTALIWGLLLLVASRLSRGALGKGDALCFLSFAFWWNFTQVFVLLLLSMLFSACFGMVMVMAKRKNKKESLPLMPFLWIAGWFLLLMAAAPVV